MDAKNTPTPSCDENELWQNGDWQVEFKPPIGPGNWHIYGGYFGNYARSFKLDEAVKVIVREYRREDGYTWRIRNIVTGEIIVQEALGL